MEYLTVYVSYSDIHEIDLLVLYGMIKISV